ncbi:hypothetical protein RSK20926_01722 [Roseobacter sp. SK209-2-6]|uniref:hypothetical protein n=1 Tax=Roseobacter sp. SK209-2-6 TaxID=388739 RepID=UPI0000F3F4FE|nr:hypothetical protein [Roseobacter sp. SK209-2-6]EBA14705.1 hypothetical protein RSK20926_01722 [Roseobacter sp. SK209-2-6]
MPDLSQQLDALRLAVPGCQLAAYGDLVTGLVLRSSSAKSYPQEYLDALCLQAQQSFLLLDAALNAGNQEHSSASEEILMLSAGEKRIFFRGSDHADDTLLCVCEEIIETEALSLAARNLITQIEGFS